MLNKIIKKLLEKDGMVSVPKGWLAEYEQLATRLENSIKSEKATVQAIKILMTEYNALLTDYANNASIKSLTEELKEADVIELPKVKEELIKLYVDTFKGAIELEMEVFTEKDKKRGKKKD